MHHDSEVQVEAEPREVCVRGWGRQVLRIATFWTRDIGKSWEVSCDNRHEEPDLSQRGAAVDRAHGRPVQIRIGRRRRGTPLLPMPEEKQQVRMDPRVWRGVCEAEGVPGQPTSFMQARVGYPTTPVLRGHEEGDQLGSIARARSGAEADLLFQQSTAKARGEVLGLRKGSSNSSVLGTKASPLLLEFHYDSNDRPPNMQGLTKTGCSKQNDALGSRTFWVWRTVWA